LSADADDIVQVALLRIMRIREHREGDAPPPASYLRKVAFSAMIDEIRRRRRRLESAVPDHDPDATAHRGHDPEQDAMAAQIAERLRRCLAALDRPRRIAVTLRLQGHGVSEAARLVGWDYKRMENLVHRGLAEMRKCLTAAGLKP
jgi:RNA polymerase sigma-70 factor (ECF subfamily)